MNRTVLMIALMALLGAGATDQPATRPASTAPAASSQAAVVPADPSTPRGALKRLSIAMEQGEEPAMRSLMYAGSDQEKKVVDAQIAQSRAFADFRAAAVKTFGDAAANEITGDVARASAQQLARVDSADVKIDGDTATVTMGGDVYQLRKFGNEWKIAIAGLLKDATPPVVDQIVHDMNAQTGVVKETAQEMAAGIYKTTDEVAVAFRGKALKVQMQRAAEAAAVNSTTAPASTTESDR